jgi:hypothetical protein
VQYPGTTGGSGIYQGKVQPDYFSADALFAKIASDQPFLLEAVGDGSGSAPDPNAPVTPNPTATPVDNSGLEVIPGVNGQTAADYTCSVSNSY